MDGGYVVALVYGAESDWVRNALAAGRVRVTIGGRDIELESPRVSTEHEARRVLPESMKPPPRILNITEYLYLAVRG